MFDVMRGDYSYPKTKTFQDISFYLDLCKASSSHFPGFGLCRSPQISRLALSTSVHFSTTAAKATANKQKDECGSTCLTLYH